MSSIWNKPSSQGWCKRQKAAGSLGSQGWNCNSSIEKPKSREEGYTLPIPIPISGISTISFSSWRPSSVPYKPQHDRWPTQLNYTAANSCDKGSPGRPIWTSLLNNGLLAGSTKHTNGYESTNRSIYCKHCQNIWFVFNWTLATSVQDCG